MLYTKIRADFKYGPKGRFYRVFLVREGINLFNFCVGLGVMLGAKFEHCFLIRDNKMEEEYVMAPFLEDMFDQIEYRYLRNYTLNKLSDHFDFEYDTGDGWDFSCKKYKKLVEKDSKEDFILLEGAGMGIWEDNIYSLYGLFDGKIDPDFTEDDDGNGYCKPWNFEINRYGEFDDPLDIEEINETLSGNYPSINDEMIRGELEYIEENDVDVNY